MENELSERWTSLRLREAFHQDVRAILFAEGSDRPLVGVPTEPDGLVEIVALARTEASTGPFSGRLPARITYVRKRPATSDPTYDVIRKVQSLVGTGPAGHETTLASGLAEVFVERFQDGKWVLWQPSARPTTTPAAIDALRLRFRRNWPGADDETCTVVVSRTPGENPRTEEVRR
jgi:hypothetical protein